MAGKSPQLREQELLEERAKLIGDYVRANPELVKELWSSIEADKRGEGTLAEEYFKKRGITSV